MLKRTHLIVFAICLVVASSVGALVSPKNGGPLPQAFFDRKAKDPTAFTMKHAWIQKTLRIKQERQRYIAEQLANGPAPVSALPSVYAASGTLNIPVFLCAFSNVPAPFDEVAMQNRMFDDPSNSVTAYYDEVSYGNLVLTGTVYAAVQLQQVDTYYEGGTPGCNGLCSNGRMGVLIGEILDARDPVIDFGIYDNDGPDGVPNSGDDDGIVDFIAINHPETGGECGNQNLYSHSWVYEGWPESGNLPYETNDAAAGGGFIKVSDYTLQPSKNCDNSTLIDIGIFCHEFGHALGLPDLYDWDGGGGNGIGYWGIMSSGNWNLPSSPAHPCAWSRMEMGWVTPTDVTWEGAIENISRVAETGEVYRLGFTNEQFRRTTFCAIAGNYSLYCGLDSTEAAYYARDWSALSLNQGGYGNNWNETLEREFVYDGTTPVMFGYQIQYDTEPGEDYAYVIIDTGGGETVLRSYTSIGGATENIDISSYLTGLTPPAMYTLKFRGVSDIAWSDEDGGHNTLCGMFVVDDVSVTGGGENYSNDFETSIDGWFGSRAVADRQEFWLVENRQVYGFDQHLPGTGLLVMHADQHIMHSPDLNSADDGLRGLVVEEADGNTNLNSGTLNKGDAGDPYPGSSNNRTFDLNSTPSTRSNSWHDTEVEMSGISDSGPTMTAFMKAGDPGPSASGMTPGAVDNDLVSLDVVINGDEIQHGATFKLVNNVTAASSGGQRAPADAEDIVPLSVRWIDPTRLEGTINIYSKSGGNWDLVVTNPDGQLAYLVPGLVINEIVATQFQSATIDVIGGDIRLQYVLFDREPGEVIRLSRSLLPDSRWLVIADDLSPVAENNYSYVDNDVEAGKTYYYKLDVLTPGEGARELHRGSATVPAGKLTMAQNFPNPFNPTTSISFYLPEQTKVHLEVYDITGSLVTRLTDGVFSAGPHNINWHGVDAMGSPVGSGVYVYRLTAGKQSISRKMLLLK
jgi:M6 family metalloprotease-like protein